MQTKKQIRKHHLNLRNALTSRQRQELSKGVQAQLIRYEKQNPKDFASGVLGYYPHGSEVSLLAFYQYLLEKNIPLAFPRVSGDTMEFYQVSCMEDFKEGAFHIMEPLPACLPADFENAVCLVPGSVFDKSGSRYGYGKGYYDRYFAAHSKILRIGIAYQQQLEEVIPIEETDIKMHALLTEHGRYDFNTLD